MGLWPNSKTTQKNWLDMDCPKCKIPMEKGHINAVSKDKLMSSTNWHCEKCGYRDVSQHNMKIWAETLQWEIMILRAINLTEPIKGILISNE